MKIISDFRNAMNPPVFLGSAGLILVFVLYGAIFTRNADSTFNAVQAGIVHYFGWFYVLAASGLLGFVAWLALSPLGRIRLGGDESRPEFDRLTWFTMLMAAGMGIGLVFFGVAEPIEHYVQPLHSEPKSREAMREAIFFSYFHWGLHPWSIYIAVALPLAYFHYRYKLPLAPRSLLYPIIGERIRGWLGHAADILGTVGTLFGVGTSLGLGAMQINAGLNRIAGVPTALWVQILTIALITTVATISVVSGLKAGIRRLSQFNMLLAGVILVFVVVAGPTVVIFETFTVGIGSYLQRLPQTSFFVDRHEAGRWQSEWTLFYWSWWIAWSPFVGIFAARISKGRTIREFVGAMLLVPTLVGFVWFAAVGGAALSIEHDGPGGIAAAMYEYGDAEEGTPLAFYAMLEHLPFTAVVSALATVLIVTFFITSSDSGSLVDVIVTSGGKEHPPALYRVFWCVTEGVVAIVLLVAGGLTALRTASLTPALPMTVLLLVACWGLVKALRTDIEHDGVPDREDIRQ